MSLTIRSLSLVLLRCASAVLLGALALSAQAGIAITGHDAQAQVGGNADVVFDVDFGATTAISSFDLAIGYDPARLSLLGGATTYQGLPIDFTASLGAEGLFSTDVTPGQVTATFFALDGNTLQPLPPVMLTGLATLTLHFRVDSLPPDGTTAVTFDLDTSDAALDAQPHLSANATVVQGVPEPTTSALLLVGGVILATIDRRRRRSPT